MIFTEDAISFSIAANPLKREEQFTKGLWLALIGINQIPPHIALISEGKYYSISAKNADCGTPLKRLIGVLGRKQIPVLFIRIEAENSKPALLSVFKDFPPLDGDESTCLSPIKKFFAENVSFEFNNVSYVFELLSLAEKKGLLKESVSLYCGTANSKSITLPKYTMVQIRNKIHQLSHQTVR